MEFIYTPWQIKRNAYFHLTDNITMRDSVAEFVALGQPIGESLPLYNFNIFCRTLAAYVYPKRRMLPITERFNNTWFIYKLNLHFAECNLPPPMFFKKPYLYITCTNSSRKAFRFQFPLVKHKWIKHSTFDGFLVNSTWKQEVQGIKNNSQGVLDLSWWLVFRPWRCVLLNGNFIIINRFC